MCCKNAFKLCQNLDVTMYQVKKLLTVVEQVSCIYYICSSEIVSKLFWNTDSRLIKFNLDHFSFCGEINTMNSGNSMMEISRHVGKPNLFKYAFYLCKCYATYFI